MARTREAVHEPAGLRVLGYAFEHGGYGLRGQSAATMSCG